MLEPADHLIVWRLDRLERSPFGMVHALEFLVNRGVNVHILEHGGMQIDLDKPMGRLLVMILAGFAGFFADQLGEAIRTAKAWRKEHGLAYHSHPPPGKVRRAAGFEASPSRSCWTCGIASSAT
jgi:DNA invertase Pin-like site-specific DNA recombinase